MSALMLLSLMGVAVISTVFMNDDKPEPEQPEPEVEPEPEMGPSQPPADPDIPEDEGDLPEQPEEPIDNGLGLNGQTSVTGTAGDDTLNIDFSDRGAYNLTHADMGDGDDIVAITGLPGDGSGVEIDGGAGNDTIIGDTENIGPGSSSAMYGGAGDDVLIGMPTDTLFGGDGNDTLSVDMRLGSNHSSALAGGAGDDLFELVTTIEFGPASTPFARVDMDEGSDTLVIDLQMNSFRSGSIDEPEPTSQSLGIGINGYDRETDAVVIEINRSEQNYDREMTSAEVTSETFIDDNGETFLYQNLVLQFAATDTQGVHTASIRLEAPTELAIEDIVFIQN